MRHGQPRPPIRRYRRFPSMRRLFCGLAGAAATLLMLMHVGLTPAAAGAIEAAGNGPGTSDVCAPGTSRDARTCEASSDLPPSADASAEEGPPARLPAHWTPWVALLAWVVIGAGIAAAARSTERPSVEVEIARRALGVKPLPQKKSAVENTPANAGALRQAPPAGDSIDRTALFERLDGNTDLLRELIELFSRQGPLLLTEIRNAIASGDGARAEMAAHSLKGALANLGADRAAEVAFHLERLARASDLSTASATRSVLEREVAHVQQSLAVLKHSPAPFGHNVAAA
jgi:HPt (histidine-containing phosphotransfer) domain-containing protein